MEVLYLLIPIAFVLVALAIKLFFWAVKSGQYDDLNTEGQRILFEENPGNKSSPPAQTLKHPQEESGPETSTK